MNDPYKTLGIPRDAPQDAVKQAYRRLAMELHPDRNPDNPRIADRFKDVNAAYGILGDALKRARFDRGDIDAWGRRRPRANHAGNSTTEERPKPAGNRKKDAGSSAKPQDGSRKADAPSAQQAKAAKPDHPKTRATTPEAPRRARKKSNGGGWLGGAIKAEDLFGPWRNAGKTTAKDRPRHDDATHRLRVSFDEAARGVTRRLTVGRGRTLDVTVPPGIRDGQIVRLKGQGGDGPLGKRDALVVVEVTPHRHFRAEGDDVHLEVPISLEEAVLGARIRVPTVAGSVEVAVPRGTNSGTILRLRGKGLERAGGKAAGDQLIHLVIKLPQGEDPDLEDFVKRRRGKVAFDPRESFATL